jgi:hypothetical protein
MQQIPVQGQEIRLVHGGFVACANLCAETGRNSTGLERKR